MNEPSAGRLAAILGDHRLMGIYGMAVGAVLAMPSSLLALCATRLPAQGLLPLLSLHLREHLPMYAGMAAGNLVSIVVASWQDQAGRREWHRGATCFLLMSAGMLAGSLAVAEVPFTWAVALGLPPMTIAMLAGMGVGVAAEHLCRRGRQAAFHRPAGPQLTRAASEAVVR